MRERFVSPHRKVGMLAGSGRKLNRLSICSWNVEGLSDVKVYQICRYMRTHSIKLVCIQETRKRKSDNYVTEDGYEILLSGRGDEEREWAGVGFIVAPHFRQFVSGFYPPL